MTLKKSTLAHFGTVQSWTGLNFDLLQYLNGYSNDLVSITEV